LKNLHGKKHWSQILKKNLLDGFSRFYQRWNIKKRKWFFLQEKYFNAFNFCPLNSGESWSYLAKILIMVLDKPMALSFSFQPNSFPPQFGLIFLKNQGQIFPSIMPPNGD